MPLTSLALLAPIFLPQGPTCPSDLHADFRGIVTGIAQTPAAPLDTIALGDNLLLELSFANDVACNTPGGLNGFLASQPCCHLTIGSATSELDPMSDPCLWGENYQPSAPFFTSAVEADAAFASGQVIARLRMSDTQGLVGISLFDLLGETIDVPSSTAAGFTASVELVDPMGTLLATVEVLEVEGYGGTVGGFSYCFSNPSSAGTAAIMYFQGSNFIADNNVTLFAEFLPQNTVAMFLTGRTQGNFSNLPGSAGVLCIGGSIGRYVGPGQLQFTGSGSSASLAIDLTQMPQPTGAIAVQSGETWNFQCWFRDVTGSTTNNFSHGYSLVFQ